MVRTRLREVPEDFPLQMEVILPEQFFTNLRARETGERLLLAAVLEDAVSCFQRFLFASRQRQRRLCRDAERWIMGRARPAERENRCPYFTFERVCDVLGLEADAVRDRLMCWRERQLADARRATAGFARQSGWVRTLGGSLRNSGRLRRTST